ncbi:hypothetical protein NDU88_000219 [Pleurodeles waltl]|uniref:Uncharacterized protein n=1 Tax=Pleurodeles waltl TaxID=8319 RepID=A0AAV7TEU6_PLEWA|nr:hypothetical protein NDU88_000219 [Pleurodeles waltl]
MTGNIAAGRGSPAGGTEALHASLAIIRIKPNHSWDALPWLMEACNESALPVRVLDSPQPPTKRAAVAFHSKAKEAERVVISSDSRKRAAALQREDPAI